MTTTATNPPPGAPPLAFSVESAARQLAISRSETFAAIRSGELRTFRVGRRRLVSQQAIRDFIVAREAAEATKPAPRQHRGQAA